MKTKRSLDVYAASFEFIISNKEAGNVAVSYNVSSYIKMVKLVPNEAKEEWKIIAHYNMFNLMNFACLQSLQISYGFMQNLSIMFKELTHLIN